jgi:hypothetical protein
MMFAGLKDGGNERGGNSRNVSTNYAHTAIARHALLRVHVFVVPETQSLGWPSAAA